MTGRKRWQDDQMTPELQKTLQKAWDSTCRVLFGQEMGRLSDYEGWLAEYLSAGARRKSHLSGKEIIVARDAYPAATRFASNEELAQNRDYALGINQIKDFDSIVEALREKCEYTGNRVLGASSNVEDSDIVMDSHYVYNSTNIEESAYVHSSFMVRKGSKYSFGSGYFGKSEFMLRVVGTFNSRRCFEGYFIPDCADLFYCHQCFGSHDLMFCFGQRSASYRIGNLQLTKEKYQQLKAKLVSEMAEELKRDKKLPSLVELTPKNAPQPLPKLEIRQEKLERNMALIEKGFASTYSLLFKKQPGSIRDYEEWLSENTVRIMSGKSAFGGTNYYPEGFAFYWKLGNGRRVSFDEIMAVGKLSAAEKDIQSYKTIGKALEGISFFTAELFEGDNFNYIESPLVYHGTNVYKTYDITYGDNTGVCFLALNSKHVYGSYRILESQFSMKCYNSLYMNRCLEMDSCSKCADSYFCHNSEALQDCMFCFNMKGRRHNVGNTQLEREKYASVKDGLVSQMAGELERKKRLKWDIYSIGGK